MSHFVVLCVLGPANSKLALAGRNPEQLVERMLSPYSEHTEVDPYKEPCYCRSTVIRMRREAAMLKELGVSDDTFLDRCRAAHKKWLDEKGIKLGPFESTDETEAHWNGLLAPMRAIEERVDAEAAAEDVALAAEKDCEDCKGTGLRETRYNPKSKWDWYQIGGRWTGFIDPTGYDPMDDPRNVHQCGHCQGARKLPLTSRIPAMWLGGEAMFNPALRDQVPLEVHGGPEATPEQVERAELIRSHRIALEAGGESVADFIRAVFPANAKWLIEDDPEHITCWCCKGTGTQVAWPTQFGRNKGDVQPAAIYKQLMARDPKKYIPYAVCVEVAGPDLSQWHERGRMGWFGCDTPHQSKDGWRSDVADLFASVPDDAAVVVVDCHI
jgi:hypothetical protein